MIGAEPLAHFEPAVARAGEDHWLRPQGFSDSDPHQPDRARTDHDDALSGNHAAHHVSPYIAVPAVTTSVASASLMSSGTCASVLMLLTAYSAKPPSVLKPLARCPFAR